MSDTTASLRRKINSAGDLQSVVRTMKALAASSIGQYEQSVRALATSSVRSDGRASPSGRWRCWWELPSSSDLDYCCPTSGTFKLSPTLAYKARGYSGVDCKSTIFDDRFSLLRLDILLNHLIGNITGAYSQVTSGPEMPPPELLLQVCKLL